MASVRAHTTATGTTTHPQLGERMTNVEQSAGGSEGRELADAAPCQHRMSVGARDYDGDLIAWACVKCGAVIREGSRG